LEGEDKTEADPSHESYMDQQLQISMHAISGTALEAKTFPLFITIGSLKLVALIDSGSSTTFIDPSIIVKADLPIQNHEPVKVTMANGSNLWTQAITLGCQDSIQGHDFSTDFRVLNLEGYDLILGCDWIFEFSPIGINMKTREFMIEKGQKICLKDETLPNANFLVSHKKMKRIIQKGAVGVVVYVHKLQVQEPDKEQPPQLKQLLEQYSDVFPEPTDLPPHRDVDHTIPLQPDAPIVNTRPYRLSHHQKDTMETLILQLLKIK
jgi:hypothetical protein